MKTKPKVIVLSGYGLNCEEETLLAFELCGATGDIVHINDLIEGKYKLSDYQIMAIGGGFAYGDDTGAGNAYANRLKNHLWNDIEKFVKSGKLVIGICNGFQILMNLGLLPALKMQYGKREMGLMPNAKPRYTVRFADLRNDNKTNSPWLKDLDSFSIMMSNGEGRLVADEKVIKEVNKKGVVAFRYYKGPTSEYLNLPYNPNGSVDDIAGLTDETGHVIGLMPHPERVMFFTQTADWQLVKEQLKRAGKPLPEFAKGLQIFKNAVQYFK